MCKELILFNRIFCVIQEEIKFPYFMKFDICFYKHEKERSFSDYTENSLFFISNYSKISNRTKNIEVRNVNIFFFPSIINDLSTYH
jgi:hypothetical protein